MKFKRMLKYVGLLIGTAILIGAGVAGYRVFKMGQSADGRLAEIEVAINLYISNHSGDNPKNLDALVPAYLKSIPSDGRTGVTKTVKVYDGSGGWVYNSKTGEVSLNLPKAPR